MNILAIVLCGVWSMLVGFVWYSPMMFEKSWRELSGISKKAIKMGQNEMAKTFGGVLLLNFLVAFVLSYFFIVTNDVLGNIMLVALLWFAFTFVPAFTMNVFGRKSFKLTLINSGYNLVTFLGFAVIFSLL